MTGGNVEEGGDAGFRIGTCIIVYLNYCQRFICTQSMGL